MSALFSNGVAVRTPQILIVDDEQYVCEVCSRALGRAAYHVTSTTDPLEALRLLQESPFDILITDIQMPTISGIELAQHARTVDPAIVIIVMTGHASMENIQEAVRRGIADFLHKPFEIDQLRLAVDQALHKRSLLQENLRLQALLQLMSSSEAINASLDLDELSRRIILAAMRETDCAAGALLLSEKEHAFGIVQYSREQQLVLPGGIALARQASASAGMRFQHDGVPLLRDGEQQFCAGLALPLRALGGSVGALLLVAAHVDARPSSHEALGILLNQAGVAIRNAQQHRELQETYDRLQDLDDMKSEFIAIASHELRTPLSIVLGYTMMVRDQLDGEQQQYLQRVFENAQRIKAIVDDMVALRYLDSDQAELLFEACDLEAVIGETCEQVQTAAREKGQELHVRLPNAPTRCSLDREKFQLVLAHLLSNAIKFTNQGGRIEVRVRVDAEIVVEVEDSGVGIPLKDQGRIFDRFYQVADSLTRAHGGTGLGLAVAKELVTVMGGTLDVSSNVGHGSTFRLALPYHPA